jgi:hypothetical protein
MEDICNKGSSSAFGLAIDVDGHVYYWSRNMRKFQCEYSPLQVNILVEKGTKAKEVTPQQPVSKIVLSQSHSHREQVLIKIEQSDQLQCRLEL